MYWHNQVSAWSSKDVRTRRGRGLLRGPHTEVCATVSGIFSWRWRNEHFHQIGDRSADSRSGVSRSREGAKTAAASGDRGGGAGERAERGDSEKESGGPCAVSPTAGVERISPSGGVCSGAPRGVWIEGCGDSAVPGGWNDFLWDAEVAAGLGCGLWGVVGGKESQGG